MSADDERPQKYESLYRLAKEMSDEADRLPNWMKNDAKTAREPHAQADQARGCVEPTD
jgi:hypothetical protein